MNLEQQIINQLFHSEKYGRFVLPYLSSEYFVDKGNQLIYERITEFMNKYKNLPTPTAIQIELEQADYNEVDYEAAKSALEINFSEKKVDYDWLIDQTEKYVKDRAVHNALRESIGLLADKERSNGEIEALLKGALSISFDSSLGLDIFDDAEAQYDRTHSEESRYPFMIDILNRATDGGVTTQSLNIIMAGCIHPDTSVIIKYDFEEVSRIVSVKASQVKLLLEEGRDVFISSPNGFVKVKDYVEKGFYDQYVLTLNDQRKVACNEDHLFNTNLYGWLTAKEIAKLTTFTTTLNFKTDKGLVAGQCVKTDFVIPIIDIVVDHPDHSYYTNGIESHNTNVGKSLILCQFAADYLTQGQNVVYFTHEMAEDVVAMRIYANLLNLDLDKHKIMPKKWFLEQIEKVKKRTVGKLKVKEYPSGGAHTGHYRHHLQELRQKQGFVAKVLIADYLAIMASCRYKPGQVQLRTYLHSIAQEYRALNQEEHTIGWTAFQTNREGFGSSDPGLINISEAWGVTNEADWIGVVSQGEDLEALNQFQWKQEKSRYSNKDKLRKFITGVDKLKQKIYDVDEHAQLQAMNKPDDEESENDDPFAKFQ